MVAVILTIVAWVIGIVSLVFPKYDQAPLPEIILVAFNQVGSFFGSLTRIPFLNVVVEFFFTILIVVIHIIVIYLISKVVKLLLLRV